MNLAIINNLTNIVENVIVKPEQGQVWDCPTGFTAIESDVAAMGASYNSTTQEFTNPIIEEAEGE